MIIAATAWAYHNIYAAPFLFDDVWTIQHNPAIQRLWPIWEALANTSRPLVRLTLAIDYAWSGLEVWSYHVTNVMIHALAGLALYALIRRTLERGGFSGEIVRAAPGLALASALLWVVHPLQTEAVTYTIQRSESMASLFYLVTILALARSADAAHPRLWHLGAVLFSLLGMASKPVMATAPIAALAYDRIFVARSFERLWRERGRVYVALFATIGVIPLLLRAAPVEWRTSSGFELESITPLAYAMTQPGVILHYLRLCFWPHPLCLDYSWPIARSASQVVLPSIVIAALLGATVIALRRRPGVGFLGFCFFLILAPTSSVMPVLDPAFEHRMYLPLAVVTALVVLAGFALLRRTSRSGAGLGPAAVAITTVLVLVLGSATIRRNHDYRSAVAIWTQTVSIRPDPPRAHVTLADALDREGRFQEAMKELDQALRRDPRFPGAHYMLGYFLARAGRYDEALPHVRLAAERVPLESGTQYMLGSVLLELGQLDPAIHYLTRAVHLEPWSAKAQNNLGSALTRRGDPAKAMPHLRQALAFAKPGFPEIHYNLAVAHGLLGDTTQARRELMAILALNPHHPGARMMMDSLGRGAEP